MNDFVQLVIENLLKASQPLLNAPGVPEILRRKIVNLTIQLFFPGVDVNSEDVILHGRHALKITPANTKEDKVLLYFHGGGYHWGSPRTHKQMVFKICEKANATAFLLDYSKAPEAPYPAALNDATHAYKAILELGYEPEQIILGGDSAGGGLTMATLVSLKAEGVSLPAGAILLSPWVDLTHSGASMNEKAHVDPMLTPTGTRNWATSYAGSESLDHPLVSPLFADLTGLPPILVHVGENEILLDDSKSLELKARTQNVDITLKVWPNMIHVFQFFSDFIHQADESISELGQFVRTA